jgi:putative FmdB family regulatory protein
LGYDPRIEEKSSERTNPQPMPLYEYLCEKCGHRFEKIQKFSDQPVKKCPECGGKVEQVISAPAVQFKGSGWYVTDYAKQGSASSDPKETKKDDKGKSDGSTKGATSKENAGKDSSTQEASSKPAEKHK